MAETLLQVDELRVEYEGVTAVDDVSFAVEAGMVYGLIGPNGAGKTSILGSIATLVEPTWGRIAVCGHSVLEDRQRALPRLGFMPDFPPLYDDLSVREFLELFASAYGLLPAERAPRIAALLELTRLGEKRDALSGELSRGMKQRLFLAKTLLHDPAVLLLDEPASGLDPGARAELSVILRDLGAAGKAVVVSSHILAEMEEFCNAVGIMEVGRMIASGRVGDVLAGLRPLRGMRVALAVVDARLGELLAASPGVSDVEVDGAAARFALDGGEAQAAALLRRLVEAGLPVCELGSDEAGLQDIFARLSSGRVS